VGFRYLYVGQHRVQWDAGIGLHLMGARHYSPTLGRFIQPDPPALEENLYAYVNNSPVTRTDPTGTWDIRRLSGGSTGGAVGGWGYARITFGHGARHLPAGISKAKTESVIYWALRSRQVHTWLGVRQRTVGIVVVNGQRIYYSAYRVSSGRINVGTYYLVRPLRRGR
jgi:RHS repeat-associated protein